MGDTFSTLSQTPPNPSMSPNSPPPSEPKPPIPETLDPTPPSQNDAVSEEEEIIIDELIKEGEAEEEEEEGECGFCLFMKAGGCKESFTNWEKCVEEGEKNKEDIVEKCFQVTNNLKKCMEEHSDYYAPLLAAEKAAEEEAATYLEKDKENTTSNDGDEKVEKEVEVSIKVES